VAFSIPLLRVMPLNLRSYEVVVIGGGVAGSAAAIVLAQRGCRVLLLEKETRAHHKVCGEFISIEAQRYLAGLGLDLPALGAQLITQVRLVHGQIVAAAPLPFVGQSLSRRCLDAAMLASAQAHGAEVRPGTQVTRLQQESSGWRIEFASGGSVFAESIFLATGKRDLRGWRRIGGLQDKFIGFKSHYKLAPAQRERLAGQVEIVLFEGGYAGLEAVEDGMANFCLVVSKGRFATYGKTWDKLLAALFDLSPLLNERFREAQPCWPRPLAIFAIPYGFVHRDNADAPRNVYRLGDQMAVIPSFSGDGIAIALHTAFRAVESYFDADASVYHRRARLELLPQIRRASLLSRLGETPVGQRGILFACRRLPGLVARIATATRLIHVASWRDSIPADPAGAADDAGDVQADAAPLVTLTPPAPLAPPAAAPAAAGQ
jgi:flavin-dependent dehydrogenase